MAVNIDKDKFTNQFERFIRYVLSASGEKQFRSFSSNETTREQEGYKYDIYEEARKILSYKDWKVSEIGSGTIHDATVKAIRVSEIGNNLVDWRIIDRYARKEIIKTTLEELERIIFDFFLDNREESEVFGELVNSIGANYSLIAYFFFIKDKQRYLPISTHRFDKSFKLIGIEDFKTTQQCNWENYQTYNLIIEEVKVVLSEKIQGEVNLLDAHSFLWMISRDIESEIKPALQNYQWKNPEVSSIKREVIQRQGQDIFRKKLMQYWNSKCSVTGFDFESLLVASHIKPWKDSTDKERFDLYNGLLLTPNLDKLFDIGLISFESNGIITISEKLSKEQRELIGIAEKMRLLNLQEKHQKYLNYHRNIIFNK